MLKSVLKCIESIRIKKGLTIFKFWEPTWGMGEGLAELVKSHFFFYISLREV